MSTSLGCFDRDELLQARPRRRRAYRVRVSATRRRRPSRPSCRRFRWRASPTPLPATAASSVQPVSAARAWPAVESLPGDAVQFAFALFDDDQDRIGHGSSRALTFFGQTGCRKTQFSGFQFSVLSDYSTRTSLRNFSTSFLATSAGGPSRNSVFLVFWGM